MRNILFVFFMLISAFSSYAESFNEQPEWEHFFTDNGVKGTIAVFDERDGRYLVFNKERAEKRFSPASTFKIPHALFALDAGVVKDEFQVFKWDGRKREYDSWNSDQNLRSSMRNSVVWVYKQFASAIGKKDEKKYLKTIKYGNSDFSGPVDNFWLNESLKISAVEQVAFLRRLYRNKLPFLIEHQRLVKDIMINEAGKYWRLRAKTGSYGEYGWYVGWVEHPDGAVFFALNIDMSNDGDLIKRIRISKDVLRSINALD